MILACDFVVIAKEAQIGDVHTPYGHMPGAGATQRLPRKIGMQRAMELILIGRWLTGAEAVAYDLALTCAPRAELEQATNDLLCGFADKTRSSLGYSKRAMLRGWDLSIADGVAVETACYLEYLATCPEPWAIFRRNRERKAAAKPT